HRGAESGPTHGHRYPCGSTCPRRRTTGLSGRCPMCSMLTVRGVGNGYGGAEVISGITFSVAQGESAARLGPNGAGKTPLLHSLFGIGPPCSGEIHFQGQAIARQPTYRIARQGVALVPQGRGSFPE